MELSPQGRLLLERRYLLPGETPDSLFSRVADLVGGPARSREFFSLISSLRFLPNSPTL
ncbi:MAG: ribonucleotide reductase N-terminal alpha domain-containing protein, partial [Methanoculleus sp.]